MRRHADTRRRGARAGPAGGRGASASTRRHRQLLQQLRDQSPAVAELQRNIDQQPAHHRRRPPATPRGGGRPWRRRLRRQTVDLVQDGRDRHQHTDAHQQRQIPHQLFVPAGAGARRLSQNGPRAQPAARVFRRRVFAQAGRRLRHLGGRGPAGHQLGVPAAAHPQEQDARATHDGEPRAHHQDAGAREADEQAQHQNVQCARQEGDRLVGAQPQRRQPDAGHSRRRPRGRAGHATRLHRPDEPRLVQQRQRPANVPSAQEQLLRWQRRRLQTLVTADARVAATWQ